MVLALPVRVRHGCVLGVALIVSTTVFPSAGLSAVSGYTNPAIPKQRSHQSKPVPARAKGLGVELLQNGSFEQNGGLGSNQFTGWTVVNLLDPAGSPGSGDWFVQTGGNSPQNSFPVDPPTLGNSAAMTDQSGPGGHALYQDLTIPPGTTTASLNCDVFINNQATGFFVLPNLDFSASPNQHARVDIMDPAAPVDDVGAGVLQNIFVNSPTDPTFQPYTTLSADLSAFAGQTVRLRFAEVDNQSFFNMGVDNCSLMAVTTAPLIPQVFIDAENDVGSEAARDSVTFSLSINPPPTADIQVGIQVDPASTVTLGEDVGPVPALIDVKSGDSLVVFSVDVLDDSLDEGVEALTLNTLPGNGYQLIPPFSIEASIVDDDGVDTVSCQRMPTPDGAFFDGVKGGVNLEPVTQVFQPVFAPQSHAVARTVSADGLTLFFSSDRDLVNGRNTDASVEIFRWSLDSDMIQQITDNQGNFAVLGVDGTGSTLLARKVLQQIPMNPGSTELPMVLINTSTGVATEILTPLLNMARQQGGAYLSHRIGGQELVTRLTDAASWAFFHETYVPLYGSAPTEQDVLFNPSTGAVFDVSAGGSIKANYMVPGTGVVFGTTQPCAGVCPTAPVQLPPGAVQIVSFDPRTQLFEDTQLLPPNSSNFAFIRASDRFGTLGVMDEEGPLLFNETRNPEGNEEIYIVGEDIYGPVQITASSGDTPICFRLNDPADPTSGCAWAADNAFSQISGDGGFVFFSSDRDIVGANPDRSYELFWFDPIRGAFAQITDRDSPIYSWLTGMGVFTGASQVPAIVGVDDTGGVLYVHDASAGVLDTGADGSLNVHGPGAHLDVYDCR